jgi:hypothetical protein
MAANGYWFDAEVEDGNNLGWFVVCMQYKINTLANWLPVTANFKVDFPTITTITDHHSYYYVLQKNTVDYPLIIID